MEPQLRTALLDAIVRRDALAVRVCLVRAGAAGAAELLERLDETSRAWVHQAVPSPGS